MADYEPLDLSKWCNAGLSVLADEKGPDPRLDRADLAWRGHTFGLREDGVDRIVVGLQSFRGIPFLVGSEGGIESGKCLVELSGDGPSATIPIGSTVRRVIFAHRLLETGDGEKTGSKVADYIFNLDRGRPVRVPIRKQIEIDTIPGNAIGAFADDQPSLLPRYEGEFGQTGWRQTEVLVPATRFYHLWVWENPEPGSTVESVEIVPTGPRFVAAAITLGHLDESPFAREGRRPARIVLTDSEEADEPFDMEVEVDRGVSSYVHPLPKQSSEEFIDDDLKGWGQSQNGKASPSYVEVSATPSATVTVKQADGVVGRVNWGEVQDKGGVETPRMRFELADPGKNWVHVAVLDDETGEPVPCRVHFRSPDGIPYQPYGHHNHVNSNLGTFNLDVGGDVRMGQITYAYIDGTCQGWLPRGEVIVDVARGFEYEPLRARVAIEPGQRELILRLKRWTNMNQQGWFSGDHHIHFLSAQGAMTETMGEDLNVANVLQSQWGSQFSSTEEFTGRPVVSQDGKNIVYVGQENRQSPFDHLILLGHQKQIMPWCTGQGGESEIGSTLEITLSDWADQCHAQGGTVISPHFSGLVGETVALIATGRTQGIELIYQRERSHNDYYRALNCGYRLPILGGTDKMSADVPVGLYRTYVRIPDDEEFTYDSWRKNVALGRTFLSSGPMIDISVDGHQIGDTLEISGPGTVEVEAWAESIFPIQRLDIVLEGEVVASTVSDKPTRRLELKEEVKVSGHTWLAARCGGANYWTGGNFFSGDKPALGPIRDSHYDGQRKGIFAHTSPVYVACGAEWSMFDEGTSRQMLSVLEGDLTYIRNISPQHSRGNVTHHHGEEDHLDYLSRPFLEARDAIHERMKEHGLALL